MRSVIIAVLACLVLSAPAMARNVEVTLPKEEGSSSMEFRAKALDEAFVEAVLQESRTLLPATLSQSREALFREALERKAGYYVLGYDSVKVTPSEEGISLTANVNVNRTALREGLKSMGLFATATKPIPVSFAVGELSAEDTSQLAGLMELTGVESASSGVAKFGLDKNEKGIFEAHLKAPGAMWQARGKDLPVVWDQVWSKYFERKLLPSPRPVPPRFALPVGSPRTEHASSTGFFASGMVRFRMYASLSWTCWLPASQACGRFVSATGRF
ncbi:hypothetical protein [Salidesulfovibrio brasiliensis]|uniref:hypothetical protein n=1 Tax=Salidesulfovibrio brasiliensis TaxID=221711 RepID=UPI0006D29D8F|nr:hypothetical protein [Salidesulfovibrio brasiliensis]